MILARGSYEVRSVQVDGRHVRMATIECGRCGRTEQIQDHGMPPTVVVKKFQRAGWATDGRHSRKNRCPDCLAEAGDDQEESEMKNVVVDLKSQASGAALAAGAHTEVSAEQRSSIRRKLDEFFDDKKGQYLDGYSDQRIGEEVGVGWKHVADLREAAYGPLKGDPQVESILRQLEQIGRVVEEADAQKVKAERETAKLTDLIGQIRERLSRIDKDLTEVKVRYRTAR